MMSREGGVAAVLGALDIRPVGVVIDDAPEPMLTSLENWVKQRVNGLISPEFKVVKEAGSKRKLTDRLAEADFVLLDHRLEDKFPGFSNGREVGEHILARRSDVPIFYYTAYEKEDLRRPRRGSTGAVKAFVEHRNVTYFAKGDLEPDGKLPELALSICDIGMQKLARRLAEVEEDVLELLVGSVVSSRAYAFAVEDSAGEDGTTRLVSLSEGIPREVVVPAKYISARGGPVTDRTLVELRILEFVGGQVLSAFRRIRPSETMLSSDIRAILEGR